MILRSGNIFHVPGLEELKLLKSAYYAAEGQGGLVCWGPGLKGAWHDLATKQQQNYPKQSTDLMQSLLKFPRHFSQS